MKDKLKLPVILSFRDYHDIDYVLEYMSEIIPKLKAEELSPCCGRYYAIFYLTKDTEYKELKREHEQDCE